MIIKEEVELYKNEILQILNSFKSIFSVFNPTTLWRNGGISRRGYLDKENVIEYSFHGSGVTIEKNNIIISFDFNEDKISLDKFKFKTYLETKFKKELEELDLREIKEGTQLISLKSDLSSRSR